MYLPFYLIIIIYIDISKLFKLKSLFFTFQKKYIFFITQQKVNIAFETLLYMHWNTNQNNISIYEYAMNLPNFRYVLLTFKYFLQCSKEKKKYL